MLQRYAFFSVPASEMPKNQCFSGVFFTPFFAKITQRIDYTAEPTPCVICQASFLSFLSFLFISFISFSPGRSVQENFPHGAGKFLAPCAVALRYNHHFPVFSQA
jgi:hypothetical protein